MDEVKKLYKELQRRVEAAMPMVKAVDKGTDYALIGNAKIRRKAYDKMITEFEEIMNLSYEKKINDMHYEFIPVAAVNGCHLVKCVQIALNEIQRKQVRDYCMEER